MTDLHILCHLPGKEMYEYLENDHLETKFGLLERVCHQNRYMLQTRFDTTH